LDPTRNNELSSIILALYKNKIIKVGLRIVMMARINKKTIQRVVASIRKIRIGFPLSHSHVF